MGIYFPLGAPTKAPKPRAVSLEVEIFLNKESKEAPDNTITSMIVSMESKLSKVLRGLVVSAKVVEPTCQSRGAMVILNKLSGQDLATTKNLMEHAKRVIADYLHQSVDNVEVRFGSVTEKYSIIVDLSEIV